MPTSATYRVVEPHPSVPHTSRPAIHTSRGGAGNVISLRNTKTTDSRSATGPASLTRLDSHVPRTFKSGRGGAGNVHSSSERAIFSFDEELERELRRAAPVYHVGRGGAGNMVHGNTGNHTHTNAFSSNHDSYDVSRKYSIGSNGTTDSIDSTADRAWDKARTSIERSWGKLKHVA